MYYIDPSGHKACLNIDENGVCEVDPDWQLKLTRKGRLLDAFLLDSGISLEKLITWGMAGELSDWGADTAKVSENIAAWENRYIQYQRTRCHGQPSYNCLVNFLASNSQSVMGKLSSTKDVVDIQANPKNAGPITYSAALQITWALMLADARNSLYNPISSPGDRLLADNVGILTVNYVDSAINTVPTSGLAANQFVIVSPSIYEGQPSYSVVMNFCQEFWWLNDPPRLMQGCFLYSYSK